MNRGFLLFPWFSGHFLPTLHFPVSMIPTSMGISPALCLTNPRRLLVWLSMYCICGATTKQCIRRWLLLPATFLAYQQLLISTVGEALFSYRAPYHEICCSRSKLSLDRVPGQIIKSFCVCPCVRACVCGHSHGRISSSIFTKLDTDV